MHRTILTPAALSGAALAELKDWLGISASGEDAPLTAVLRSALDLCEGFTGLIPLETACEEVIPARAAWHKLTVRPVHAVTGVAALASDGTRSPLPVQTYAIDLDPDGHARVRLSGPASTPRLIVEMTAGLAPDWDNLPPGLRHGVIRLAADLYRDRTEPGAPRTPPAAVAALWRPWRALCLA